MTFRMAWFRDWRWRLFDGMLHGLAGLLLHSWFQWIPDVMLPCIWLHGMISNRRLPDDSVLLRIHRWLHSVYVVGGLWVAAHWSPSAVPLALNWSVHWLIDSFTHAVWHKELEKIDG